MANPLSNPAGNVAPRWVYQAILRLVEMTDKTLYGLRATQCHKEIRGIFNGGIWPWCLNLKVRGRVSKPFVLYVLHVYLVQRPKFITPHELCLIEGGWSCHPFTNLLKRKEAGMIFFFYALVRGPSYLSITRSMSWLLMPWLLASPGHQHPWYWPRRIGRSVITWRISTTCVMLMWRRNAWQKMWCSRWKI